MRRIAVSIMTVLLLLPSAAGAETQNVVKSIIFPGWGQYATGRYTRGTVMMGTALLSLGAIGGLTLQYNRHVDSYNNAARGFMQADYIGDASEYYGQLTKSWNDADDAYTSRNIAIGVLIGMYVWSILDMAIGPEANVPPVTLEVERDGFRVTGSFSF